jgi:hypothetical protein
MQYNFRSLVVLSAATLFFICGCRDSSDAPGGGGDFQGRLAAAKAISNSAAKDEALSKLAVDAGTHGEGDIVKQAIGAMNNSASKDNAAQKSALRLAKAGKGEDATDVAKMISNTAARDQTLAKLAKGDLSD